jgi:hypothetical protein
MKREKKEKPISTRVSIREYKMIEFYCDEQKLSFSQFLRKAVESELLKDGLVMDRKT